MYWDRSSGVGRQIEISFSQKEQKLSVKRFDGGPSFDVLCVTRQSVVPVSRTVASVPPGLRHSTLHLIQLDSVAHQASARQQATSALVHTTSDTCSVITIRQHHHVHQHQTIQQATLTIAQDLLQQASLRRREAGGRKRRTATS